MVISPLLFICSSEKPAFFTSSTFSCISASIFLSRDTFSSVLLTSPSFSERPNSGIFSKYGLIIYLLDLYGKIENRIPAHYRLTYQFIAHVVTECLKPSNADSLLLDNGKDLVRF